MRIRGLRESATREPGKREASKREPGKRMATRQRAAAGAASRERMIEAAITLMRGSGLSGAGINEIVRESGAPKGSVYHFFPAGKQQIVAEALDLYAGRVQAFIESTLASRADPADKVKALFDAFARRAEDGGFRSSCAVGTVSLDLDDEVAGLRDVLAAALDAWTVQVAAHFDFGDARRARSFAGLLLTAIEGAYVRTRADASSRAFREAGTWLAGLAKHEFGAGERVTDGRLR